MQTAVAILLLWLIFAGSHIGLSSRRMRPKLVAALGENGFLAVYSAFSLLVFGSLVTVYAGSRHGGPLLWSVTPSGLLLWVLYAAMAVAFVLVVASLATPSPSSMSTRFKATPREPRGVHHITRHALFMGIGLFGLVHLVPNGHATDIVFFAGFPVFAVLGSMHQDARKLADGAPGYREFCDRTPLIPFTGGQTLRGLRELSPVVVGLGIVLTILVRMFHGSLFGV